MGLTGVLALASPAREILRDDGLGRLALGASEQQDVLLPEAVPGDLAGPGREYDGDAQGMEPGGQALAGVLRPGNGARAIGPAIDDVAQVEPIAPAKMPGELPAR